MKKGVYYDWLKTQRDFSNFRDAWDEVVTQNGGYNSCTLEDHAENADGYGDFWQLVTDKRFRAVRINVTQFKVKVLWIGLSALRVTGSRSVAFFFFLICFIGLLLGTAARGTRGTAGGLLAAVLFCTISFSTTELDETNCTSSCDWPRALTEFLAGLPLLTLPLLWAVVSATIVSQKLK